MMLNLTNAHPDLEVKGKPVLISVRHIVSLQPFGDRTRILTAVGANYIVKESMDEIGKMSAWDRV